MTRRPVRRGSRALNGLVPRSAMGMSSTMTATESQHPTPSTAEVDLEADSIPIASLTLDTPLTPLRRKPRPREKPFPFLKLPSELRLKVYEHFFSDTDMVLDLGPDNYKRIHKTLGFMRVCKQLHTEATHFFYSTRSVRLFPTDMTGKYFKSKKPMLSRLKPRQRQCLTTLELRLGPGWNAPPRGWVVNEALGLKDCANVRKLCVYVEVDPSDSFFKGFRLSDGFYEGFSAQLLANVADGLPDLHVIEFDARPCVKKSGAMMRGLLDAAAESGHLIQWGHKRGWTDGPEEETTIGNEDEIQFVDGIPLQDYITHNLLAVA